MRKITIILGLIALIITSSCKNDTSKKTVSDVKLKTAEDTLSYMFGMMVQSNIFNVNFNLNEDALLAGMQDSKNNTLKIPQHEANGAYQKAYRSLFFKTSNDNTKEAEDFMDNNKKNEGIVTTESGLQYKIIKEGNGEIPTENDMLTIHYKGELLDGTVFDSSLDRGEPIKRTPSGFIQGWKEALLMMPVGSKWQLFVPPHLGYGDRPPRGSVIGPNAALVFELEILDLEKSNDTTSTVKPIDKN